MAADLTSKVPIGTVLVAKYRITREVGRGGMAVVYEAENIHIGKRVAVKVLSAELITSRIVRERFLREARAAAAVRSPYICDVYDAGEFDNRPFLVMELLEGESLYDLMSSVRRLDTEQTLKITVQTAKGLAKAHAAHVVHRDLKPENLFLTHNEEGELVTKLLDFGLAKFYIPSDESAEQVRLTREGALFGTPAYMSPEQARGKGEVDHRTDLWALGCIVYECLTGQTVWNVDQGVAMILAQVANSPLPIPSHLRPDLPPAFDAWFEKALERDQDKRFQTAREFALALTEVLNPAAKSSVQTPSLLVDVDELTSRIGTSSSDDRAPVSSRRVSAASGNRSFSAPNNTNFNRSSATVDPGIAPSIAPGRSRSGSAIWALLVLAAAAAGIFYGYRSWTHGPAIVPSGAHAQPTPSGPGASEHGKSSLDGTPYAESVYRAQDALAKGDTQQALSELDVAIRNGGEGLATNLRSHIRVALEPGNGPCHLAGIARPRPFNANTTEDVSRPSVIDSPPGTIFGWAQHQVFTTLLDGGLRSKDKPSPIAPEAANARHPQLVRNGGQLTLLFWNGFGSEPGVFVRELTDDGKISGPIRRVGPIGHGSYSPSMASAPDGTSWVIWEDDSADGVTNLVARHLDRSLSPIGNIIQLTALKPDRMAKPGAIKPSIAIASGHLNVAFVQRFHVTRRALWMSFDLSGTELQMGLTPSKGKAVATSKDRFLTKVRPLDSSGTQVDETHADAATPKRKPGQGSATSDDVRLACATNYCVAIWNDVNSIQVAYLDAQSGEPIWRRSLGKHGAHGAIAAVDGEAAVAWYEASRVQFAIATRNGISDPSVIAKVSGTGVQPYPEIAPSRTAHEWYLAWRDYEAGHFEAMLARAACTSQR